MRGLIVNAHFLNLMITTYILLLTSDKIALSDVVARDLIPGVCRHGRTVGWPGFMRFYAGNYETGAASRLFRRSGVVVRRAQRARTGPRCFVSWRAAMSQTPPGPVPALPRRTRA